MQTVRTSWPAAYFDGETARRQEVSLRVSPSGLHFRREDGSDVVWAFGEFRQTQGTHRGEPVRLERGLEALVVREPEFLAELGRYAPRLRGRFRAPASSARGLMLGLGSGLGVVGLVAWGYFWGIPAFARVAAARVPPSWEERLGHAIVDQLVPDARRCQDPAANAAVGAIVERLAGSSAGPYRYRVLLVDDMTVNALAAPGGYVVLYRGLVERARSPEEIAGVLAHEMEHVRQRHVTQALFQQLSLQALLAALVGDVKGVGTALQTAENLGALRYSREAELEADRAGMGRIREARIDPRGMVRFFRDLQEQEGSMEGWEALSTHPPTRERLAEAERLAAMARPPFEPVLTPERWEALRQGFRKPANRE